MITFKQYLEEQARAPLYHGTSYLNLTTILRTNVLRTHPTHGGDIGKDAISLTRSFKTAARWRSGEIVLELDQNLIKQKHKIIPVEIEYIWATKYGDGNRYKPKSSKLFEEYITSDLKPLSKYLICIHYNERELNEMEIENLKNVASNMNILIKAIK